MGVFVGSGVADGVPGPGVSEGVGVLVAVWVGVLVPGMGDAVRVGAGGLVGCTGALVGGIGVIVTMGVTGRKVGEGVVVVVLVGVGVSGSGGGSINTTT